MLEMVVAEDVLVADGRVVEETEENDGGDDEHEGRVELEDHPRRTNVIDGGENALENEGPTHGVG